MTPSFKFHNNRQWVTILHTDSHNNITININHITSLAYTDGELRLAVFDTNDVFRFKMSEAESGAFITKLTEL